jgi:valyl-tRNA synthetase
VFLHATILDGKGERMSKSKGNGIDPLDIVERYGADALRYVVCDCRPARRTSGCRCRRCSPFTEAGHPNG